MAKVTILIEPEGEHEGDYGHTTMIKKENVVTLNQLVDVYLYATKGGSWEAERIGAVNGVGLEFWGES